MPQDLYDYVIAKGIDSSDTTTIKRVVENDPTLDAATKKKWLKYCKFATGAEIALNIISGMF